MEAIRNKEISNGQLYDILVEIKSMMQCFMRANKSNKFHILESEIKQRGRMDVGDVQSFLGGISRPWALNLMRKLGKENHFDFIKGDMTMRRPSLIIYNAAQATQEKYDKIKELMGEFKIVSFAQICHHLGLNLERDFDILKRIIENFVEKEQGYLIKDGNKLCCRTISKTNC